jgi:hypothetical protein
MRTARIARRPACMDDREWHLWRESNADVQPRARVETPCLDCELSFAVRMKSAGSCDGVPGTRRLVGTPAELRRREQWRRSNRKQYERRRLAAAS